MFIHPTIPKIVAVKAVNLLATVDYSVATRVSEDVAEIVNWANARDMWWLSVLAVDTLQRLDEAGSFLIAFVSWLVLHAQ